MQTFLTKIAEHITKQHAGNWENVCLVFPSRRATVFFKQAFAKQLNKPAWAPQLFSVEDFIQHLTGLTTIDQTRLLFEFYDIYKNTPNITPEPFDAFCKWAPSLLSDFNEANLYLADTDKLFSNLTDVKEIENWSFNSQNLSQLQKQYLNFWKLLGNWHTQLNQRLLNQQTAYPGLAYRKAAQEITSYTLPWNKIYFCGFNALTKSELFIIRQLVSQNKAETLWDADSYYLNDEFQEAGTFLRKYKKDFAPLNWIENNLSTDKKQINIIGASKNVMQTKVAADIIQNLINNNHSLSDTALVLNNENLLFPMLNAIPEQAGQMNITMGYPLALSNQFSFIESLFTLYIDKIDRKLNANTFHHQALLQLLQHPVTKQLLEIKAIHNLKNNIITRNNLYISTNEIIAVFENKTNVNLLFNINNNTNAFIQSVLDLLNSLSQQQLSEIDKEFIFQLQCIFNQINELNGKYKFIEDIRSLSNIFSRLAKLVTIPFYGEPLQGLQMMGMLETRLLDFKNVIMLSVNEGVLPKGKSAQSFIPFDLKKLHGLPTHTERDAIFAYHFYRLLQRAQNIYLIYNTNTDAFGSGEKSRFIEQLKHELPTVNPNAVITEQTAVNTNVVLTNLPISIAKSQTIIDKLNSIATGAGFSPTSLSTYVRCKLQFYYRYILKLKETDDVEDAIGADVFGNIIHESLHQLYLPFVGKKITEDDINKLIETSDIVTESTFKNNYKGELFGKNLLAYRISLKFVKNFLKREKELVQKSSLTILALETPLQTDITLSNNLTVKIAGKADRIDTLNNTTRIIDYKTGNVAPKELKVKELEQIITDPQYNKSLQLLSYGYLFNKTTPGKLPLNSGIVSLKNPSAGLMSIKINDSETLDAETLLNTETQLKDLLENIFDPSASFSQTDNEDMCSFCPYKTICNK